jgi:hypothetical protein
LTPGRIRHTLSSAMTTTISPDNPLKIPAWIPLVMTAAGFIYLAVAISSAAGGGVH